jgi:hypothetical protein
MRRGGGLVEYTGLSLVKAKYRLAQYNGDIAPLIRSTDLHNKTEECIYWYLMTIVRNSYDLVNSGIVE